MRRRLVLTAAVAVVLSACSAPAPGSFVLDGRVDLGPLCPVERAGSPCPVPPGAFTGVEVVATSDEAEQRASVAADGSFRLTLSDGSWTVTSTAGMSCTPVTASASGIIVIACDTGIR
jgi:hypothetical protein